MSSTTHDAADPAPDRARAGQAPHGQGFVPRRLFGANHKTIGTLYLVFAVAAGILGSLLSALMRWTLMPPASPLLHGGAPWNAIVTAHGLMMIFFMVLPALIGGFGNWFIPLMIGATDVAFPRMNAVAFWLLPPAFIAAALGLILGSGVQPPALATTLTLLALLLAGASSLLGAMNFITTILNMRAPGMTLHKMPVFVWAQLVTAFLLVLALPVLAGGVTMEIGDRYFGTAFFAPTGSGAPDLFEHFFWFLGHAEVTIIILPAFGIISEVIATFSGRPIAGRLALVYALVAIGAVGFVVWAHHMFIAGTGLDGHAVFMAASFAIAVPTAIALACWLVTLRDARTTFATPMLFAAGFIILFVIGGVTGVLLSDGSSERTAQNPYAVIAHLHYVLSLGAVFAIFSGFYYWIGKITGHPYPEACGKLHFWLFFIGVNLTFFPLYFVHPATAPSGWTLLSSVGAFISGVSVLVFFYVCYRTFTSKVLLPANYWGQGATTMEWQLPSPPPYLTFEALPRFD